MEQEKAKAKRSSGFPVENKCRPILVQGLRQDIDINCHIFNTYGSVAKWISAWLWI